MAKSHTNASISSFTSSVPLTVKSAQEHPHHLSSNGKIRLTASAGRGPVPVKKKLTVFFMQICALLMQSSIQRNTQVRSLSQSLSDVAELVAGHAYDNVSEWFDAPKNPVGHGDKEKLARATTMTALKAAQLQQKVSHTCITHTYTIYLGGGESALALHGAPQAKAASRSSDVTALHAERDHTPASADSICGESALQCVNDSHNLLTFRRSISIRCSTIPSCSPRRCGMPEERW